MCALLVIVGKYISIKPVAKQMQLLEAGAAAGKCVHCMLSCLGVSIKTTISYIKSNSTISLITAKDTSSLQTNTNIVIGALSKSKSNALYGNRDIILVASRRCRLSCDSLFSAPFKLFATRNDNDDDFHDLGPILARSNNGFQRAK